MDHPINHDEMRSFLTSQLGVGLVDTSALSGFGGFGGIKRVGHFFLVYLFGRVTTANLFNIT